MRISAEQEQVEVDAGADREGVRAGPQAHLAPGAGAERHEELEVEPHFLDQRATVGPEVQVAPVVQVRGEEVMGQADDGPAQ